MGAISQTVYIQHNCLMLVNEDDHEMRDTTSKLGSVNDAESQSKGPSVDD